MFFQPVVHLGRLGVRKTVQPVDDELRVGLQQKRTLSGCFQMAFVLCLCHRQITLDGSAVQLKFLRYPVDGPVVLFAVAVDSIVHD